MSAGQLSFIMQTSSCANIPIMMVQTRNGSNTQMTTIFLEKIVDNQA